MVEIGILDRYEKYIHEYDIAYHGYDLDLYCETTPQKTSP
jgi:hypothetical protein